MSSGNTAKWANYSIILVMIVLALFFLGNVILPFVLALFLTILLLPIVKFLEKFRFPRWLSALFAVGFFTGIIVVIGFFLFREIEIMVGELPKLIYKDNTAVNQIQDFVNSPDLAKKLNDSSQDILDFGIVYLKKSIGYISSTLFMIGIIPVYIFFMLMSKERVDSYVTERYGAGNIKVWSMLSEIKKTVQHYLAGLGSVIFIVGAMLAIGLYFLGIPYWLLFGVICGLLSLFPYVGIAIGALLPLTIALLTKDSLLYPLAVLGLFVLVQFLEGNIITPKVIGNAVNINPVALMFALLLMGVISGILGLIITIPTLAVVRILMESSDTLKPYARLIANKD